MRFSAIVAAVGLSTTPVLAGPGVLFGLNAMVNDYNAINVSLASGDTAVGIRLFLYTTRSLVNLTNIGSGSGYHADKHRFDQPIGRHERFPPKLWT